MNPSETITIKHDGQIDIAIGDNAKSSVWIAKQLSWRAFLEKLQIPVVTQETQEQYQQMSSNTRVRIKDVGGYVGGVLQGLKRGKNDIVSRQLIALDLDDAEAPGLLWEIFCFQYQCAAALHSTHSHTPGKPKLRLLIPVNKPLTAKNYTAIAKHLASSIGIGQFDSSTYEANRLMFWPSVSKDGEYIFQYNDAPWLDVAEIIESIQENELLDLMSKDNPTNLPGTPGVFCKAFNVPEAIQKFLYDVYKPDGDNRYRLIGAHTGAGLVIYGDGAYAYSHHANHDPAAGKLQNAFELVRIHKFGSLDKAEHANLPAQARPSFKAMLQWLEAEKICEVINWVDNIAVNSKGVPLSTIENMRLIMENDEQVMEAFYHDEFSDKLMVCNDFPWIAFIDRTVFTWSDVDDAGLREFFESKYNIYDVSKINDAIVLTAENNKQHPVRNYLNALKWDETPRLDELLIKFLRAEDTAYTRAVTRKALIGAVARILQPGCKHDHILVLVGPQGCRKSTTIHRLGGKWYSDSLYSMNGKEAYELLQGYWIIEVSEMAAAKRSDIEQMKQFISKQTDNFRAAYARRTVDHPRQCAFFGSTNDTEFLLDPTGARRFWPVAVGRVQQSIYNELNDEYVAQVWAEALNAYRSGEPWYLDDTQEDEARGEQDRYRSIDQRTGIVERFLETYVPEGWNNIGRDERLMAYQMGDTGRVRRDRICALEIWCECLGGQTKDFNSARAREINAILRAIPGWKQARVSCGPYGAQRGFTRIVKAGE